MFKIFLLFSFMFTLAQADIYQKFATYLHAKDYKHACRTGSKIVYSGEKDEKLLSVIAQTCLKSDSINMVSLIQGKLRQTQKSRTNAVVLASIALQKKLIYQFMYDGVDISTLALPVTEHPLSYAFTAIRDGKFELLSKQPKIIGFKKADLDYKVFIDKKDRGRVIIEIEDSHGNKQRRRYL